jgi:hypothetical protein
VRPSLLRAISSPAVRYQTGNNVQRDVLRAVLVTEVPNSFATLSMPCIPDGTRWAILRKRVEAAADLTRSGRIRVQQAAFGTVVRKATESGPGG